MADLITKVFPNKGHNKNVCLCSGSFPTIYLHASIHWYGVWRIKTPIQNDIWDWVMQILPTVYKRICSQALEVAGQVAGTSVSTSPSHTAPWLASVKLLAVAPGGSSPVGWPMKMVTPLDLTNRFQHSLQMGAQQSQTWELKSISGSGFRPIVYIML